MPINLKIKKSLVGKLNECKNTERIGTWFIITCSNHWKIKPEIIATKTILFS